LPTNCRIVEGESARFEAQSNSVLILMTQSLISLEFSLSLPLPLKPLKS